MNDKMGGLGLDGSLNKLLDEAQKMQERMKKAQADLASVSVDGKSGGGLVKVFMNGRHEVTKVIINKQLLEDDVAIIEDLVAAAVNDATRKVELISKEKIQELTQGLQIPQGFMGEEEEGGAAGA